MNCVNQHEEGATHVKAKLDSRVIRKKNQDVNQQLSSHNKKKVV